MAHFTISPSGDVVLAMSLAEAIGLEMLLGCEQPSFDSPAQARAASRASKTLGIAVAEAKFKGRNRALHSQREALKRMDREEG